MEYEELLREESQQKKASINIYFQKVNFDVGITEVAIKGSYIYPVLTKIEGKLDKKVKPGKKKRLDNNRVYTFDVSKTTQIFDYLVKEKFITYSVGRYIPFALEIKKKTKRVLQVS